MSSWRSACVLADRRCQVCSARVSHGSGGYGGTWLFRGEGNGIPKWHSICLLGVGPGFFLNFWSGGHFKKNSIWTFEDVYSEILLTATRNPGSTHQLSLVVGPSHHVMTGSSTIQKAGKETLQISGRKDRAKGR